MYPQNSRAHQQAMERSYQRGRIGCYRLIIFLQLGGLISLTVYAFNRPYVRTIDVEVPQPYVHKYVEPPTRKTPTLNGRKMD